MTRLGWLLGLVLFGGASDVSGQSPSCTAGSTARFTVTNNCGDDVWMIETAPGSPLTQPSVLAQWHWFNKYASQFGVLPIGAGSIDAGSTVLTWTTVPSTLPVAGVTITVVGAGPGAGD